MDLFRRRPGVLLVALFSIPALASHASAEQAQVARGAGPALVNWHAPATYTPANAIKIPLGAANGSPTIQSGELGGGPFPFFPITPCRQYDSRNTSALPNNTPRTVLLSGAPCGIPSTSLAISVNITVFTITGATGNGVFKVGIASPPTTAWINFPPSETQRANAGIVSTDGSGNIVVQVNQGAGSLEFTVDVNGYYFNGNASDMPNGDYFSIVGDYALFGGVLFGENIEPSAPSYGVNGFSQSSGTGSAGVHGENAAGTGITAGVQGDNISTSGFANGVLGQILSSTPGANSSGVRGINNGTGGNGIGVYGSQNGNGYGVFGYTPSGEGVFGDTTSGYGVLGQSSTFVGVKGEIFDTNARAGVVGLDDSNGDPGTNSVSSTAGVMGRSEDGLGVVGISGEIGEGVAGISVDSTGAEASVGYLGFSNVTAVFAAGDFTATGTKSFLDPHPSDASKVIRYVSIEANEALTAFRGTSQTVGGRAVITVPEDFRMVTDTEGLTVQLTPVGALATMAVVSEDLNQIVVQSSQDVKFHYMVNGVRAAFKDYNPIQENVYFGREGPGETMATALAPEQKARLIANGTYNADGTINMVTATRLGWDKAWATRGNATRTAPEAKSKPLSQQPQQ